MYTRRRFLGAIGLPAAYATVGAPILAGRLDLKRALSITEDLAGYAGSPKELAANEEFWREVQQAFTIDRSLVNLNNGGVSPAPAVVQEAMKRYLDFSHQAPTYNMWRILEPQKDARDIDVSHPFGLHAECRHSFNRIHFQSPPSSPRNAASGPLVSMSRCHAVKSM